MLMMFYFSMSFIGNSNILSPQQSNHYIELAGSGFVFFFVFFLTPSWVDLLSFSTGLEHRSAKNVDLTQTHS